MYESPFEVLKRSADSALGLPPLLILGVLAVPVFMLAGRLMYRNAIGVSGGDRKHARWAVVGMFGAMLAIALLLTAPLWVARLLG